MVKKEYWAGFCDGKIAIIQNLSGMNTTELFTNKKHAKRFYQDVRKVEVRIIKGSKKQICLNS